MKTFKRKGGSVFRNGHSTKIEGVCRSGGGMCSTKWRLNLPKAVEMKSFLRYCITN